MAKRKCSEKQIDEMVKLYTIDGISCAKIGQRYSINVHTVSSYLKNRNIVVINKQNIINWKEREVIEDYNKGISIIKIMEKYNTSYNSIKKCFDKHNIIITNHQNKTKFNQYIFDCIDTEEKAYWLGFLYANGYIDSSPLYDNKKSTYNFELSLALKDLVHLEKFNAFMKHENYNIKIDSYRCRWYITNKHLWTILNNYGCIPQKSLTLEFPNENIFKDKSLIRHFIRGYFDGDGSVCKYINKSELIVPQVSILGTPNFMEKYKSFFWKTNKLVKNHNSDKTLILSYNSTKAVAFLYYIYKNSSIYLDRKYQKFIKIKNCRFRAKALKLLESKYGEGWDANTVVKQ